MAKKYIQNLPFSLEAEQNVLGAIIMESDMQEEMISQFTRDDFFDKRHQIIYDAIFEILFGNQPIDLVIIKDRLNKTTEKSKRQRKFTDIGGVERKLSEKTMLETIGGLDYLLYLSTLLPSPVVFEHHKNIVLRDSVLRKLIIKCNNIIDDANTNIDANEVLMKAEKEIYSISESLDKSSLDPISHTTGEVIEEFSKIATDKNYNQGLRTWFPKLDNNTHGFHKGNLIILGARPSIGKTTLALNIATNCAIKSNAVIAFFALEMSKKEMTQRLICSLAGVSNQKAKDGHLDSDEWRKIMEAQAIISESDIFIDDTSMTTVPEILSKCRRLKAKMNGRLDLIIVDHIQLMNTEKKNVENRQQEITDISRGLKMIAKDLGVSVLALSQLSRDSAKRTDHSPQLSDLRESGAIEQDADIVLFIHREAMKTDDPDKKVFSDDASIIIAKNREGPTTSFKLHFVGELNRFEIPTFGDLEAPGNLGEGSEIFEG